MFQFLILSNHYNIISNCIILIINIIKIIIIVEYYNDIKKTRILNKFMILKY